MKSLAAFALVTAALILQTSRASADEDDVIRTHFSTSKPPAAVESVVCQLAGTASIGGRARAFDMRIDDRRCSTVPMPDDAFAVRAHVEPRDDGRYDVTVESVSSEGVPAEDVRVAVTDIGREINARLESVPRRPVVQTKPATVPTMYSPILHQFGKASVVLGSVMLGGGMLVGIGALLVSATQNFGCQMGNLFSFGSRDATCSSSPKDGLIAAGVVMGNGLAFLVTGLVSVKVGGRKVNRVSAYVTPNGGGFRVSF